MLESKRMYIAVEIIIKINDLAKGIFMKNCVNVEDNRCYVLGMEDAMRTKSIPGVALRILAV